MLDTMCSGLSKSITISFIYQRAQRSTILRIIKYLTLYWWTLQKSTALFCIWKRSSSNCSITYCKRGNIETKDYKENTPFHVACSRGHLQIVQCFSEAGDDIKAKNKNQNTRLHYASSKQKAKIQKIPLYFSYTDMHLPSSSNYKTLHTQRN